MGQDQLFHKNRERKNNELVRREASKAPYDTYLIVCEGETERNYFIGLIKYYRLNVANVISIKAKGSAPINVIQHGINYSETHSNIDHVICVFDRDDHKTYHEAIKILENHKPSRGSKSKPVFQAITSSPCFEIWILLHFIYTSQEFGRTGNKSSADNLIKSLKNHFPEYTKANENLFSTLVTKLPQALKNAKKLLKENEETGSVSPETKIHLLVEKLMNLTLS